MYDNTLVFSPFNGTGDAVPVTASTNTDCSTPIDLTGAGSGNAPAMSFGINAGTAVTFGADLGIGDGVANPAVEIVVVTSPGATGTISFALLGAPDNGSNIAGTYQPIASTGQLNMATTGQSLPAGTRIRLPIPPLPLPGQPLPRFLKVQYQVGATLLAHAAAFSAAIVMSQDTSLTTPNFARNY